MTERHNTVVCVFDKSSRRISAYAIHEWLYAKLQLPEDDVQMVQIDGPTRHVYIKFESAERMSTHLPTILGTLEYLINNGELSKVIVTPTGIGFREVRIAGLPLRSLTLPYIPHWKHLVKLGESAGKHGHNSTDTKSRMGSDL
jgi:hypothetical protein